MADINQQATVQIEVNSESAKRKIAELENKLVDLNKKKQEFEKTGNTAGLVKIEKELQKVDRQMNNARTNAQKCEAALKKLSSASPKELSMTLRQLQNDLNHIERGSKAWNEHVQAIKRVKAEINAVDAELKEHKSLMSQIKDGINGWGMTIASAAAALTGITMTARQAVEAYAEMDAEMANVQKYTGMTAEQVEHLNESFKKMDTRTSREELNKLAQEAGRLGLQTEQDVLGFVKAADIINVALDDLGEGATLTLSKLTDIFGDKERYGVEESLLKVGSIINELSQSCSASAPYIADFAQRLAGTGKIAEMSSADIMGYAAVLDSQGQALEMSATAVSQTIMKLYKDPAKIAKVAGLDLQQFNKVLKEDTNEAMLMLLERLKELGGPEVLAPKLAQMGLDGARSSQVLFSLAGNVDMLRQKQKEANAAFKEGTSVIKEFNVQNNTVKAQLDKAKKGFNEMAVQLGAKLAPAMKHVISGTSMLMNAMLQTIKFIGDHIGVITGLTAAIVAYTVAVNAATVAENASKLAKETLIPAFKNLWKVIISHPYAALASAITIVIGLYLDLTREVDAQAEAERTLNDIRTEAAKRAAEEMAELEMLLATANSVTTSYDNQRAAVNALNKRIPGLNGNINAQTRAFQYSTSALNDYNNQLVRLYELEGAREKIKELSRKKVDLQLEARQIKQQIEDEKKFQKERSDNILAYGNPNDPNPSATQTTGDYIRLGQLERSLNKVNSGIAAIDNTIRAIHEEYKDVGVNSKVGAPPETPTSNITGGGGGSHGGGGGSGSHGTGGHSTSKKTGSHGSSEAEKERKKREAEEKKRQQEEEKRKRQQEAMEAKDFKKAFDLLKSHRDKANAAAKKSYADGKIDYETYLKKLNDARTEFYDNTDALFKKHELEETDELAKLHNKRADEEKEYYDQLRQLRLDAIADDRDKAQIKAEMDFYDESNEVAFKNEEYRDARLAQINLDYLKKVLKEQNLGSKEYYDAERALDKAIKEEELRQRQALETKMADWLTTYNMTSAKFRMTQELALLDVYYKDKKDKEKEYQEARQAIEKKYRDMVDEATGTHGNQMSAARDEMDTNLKVLDAAHEAGLVGEEDYQSRRYQIIKAYHDQVKELVSSEGNEWATMLVDLQENWKNVFENLGSTIPEILENIGDAAAATFAIMNAGLQSYSNYANAARDLEVAKVTKSYDEQIKAAGNNEKKTKKLEEKKQAEIAKVKSKYNKRAQTIEIAQAIASTALAAINAYASASKVSWILGPIAAAMATAAGAIQIATIRKQHQAEEMGYASGGFTPRDPSNQREVGVVHANEFVANSTAVANPALMPVLRLIDQAQRNNTVGSLTSEDVSRALGQGGILGEMTSNQQRSLTEREASMALVAAAMEQQSAAIVELNRRLEQGIESFMVMDGERGFEKYWENYQALKERPRR